MDAVLRHCSSFIVWLYLLVVFGRLILDWIRVFARDWRPRGVMLVIAEAVYTLTDPPLNALRKVIPPIRLGGCLDRPRLPRPGPRLSTCLASSHPLGWIAEPLRLLPGRAEPIRHRGVDMALSPEDVLNKTFTTTQFRRGYDEREVDDFLDDIVAEMRRMTKADDEVRQQLNDCREGRGLEPVTAAMPVPAAGGADRSAEIATLEGRNSELEARVRELEELEGRGPAPRTGRGRRPRSAASELESRVRSSRPSSPSPSAGWPTSRASATPRRRARLPAGERDSLVGERDASR